MPLRYPASLIIITHIGRAPTGYVLSACNTPAKVVPEQPLGPRHFCFHPGKDMVYFSNEQGCSVSAYRLDTSAGAYTLATTIAYGE